jgi:hypothetical protein
MRTYRIVSFSVVNLLMTVLFTGAVTVPAAAQYDMMQYRYNAEHTGDYSPVGRVYAVEWTVEVDTRPKALCSLPLPSRGGTRHRHAALYLSA